MIAELTKSEPVVQAETCPAENQRKVAPSNLSNLRPIVIDAEGTWHIHRYDEARQILRSQVVTQAGFLAEKITANSNTVMKNRPILYLEGDEHHRMRRETNRFFTPVVTDKNYRDFMSTFADELIAKLHTQHRMDLSEITMEMALRVTAQVVGLTDSLIPGLNDRLNGLLNTSTELGRENPNYFKLLLTQRHMLSFLWLDVKPAIRARRKNPQNDVISYLITRNYSDIEILTECVVYGVAGMATTREFICVALWHLLENPRLRQRMLVGSEEERYAILHEILRLEPIIGHLYRRATAPIDIVSDGEPITIPAGTLIDLNIYAANVDHTMAGDNSEALCPMRPLHSEQGKVSESVLSFGDGYHRCPGAYIAIQESDIFLRKLLAIDSLRLEGTPDVSFNDAVKSYEIRKFTVAVD